MLINRFILMGMQAVVVEDRAGKCPICTGDELGRALCDGCAKMLSKLTFGEDEVKAASDVECDWCGGDTPYRDTLEVDGERVCESCYGDHHGGWPVEDPRGWW